MNDLVDLHKLGEQATSFVNEYPAVAMVFICIGLGAVLKKARFFPNNRIPLVMAILGTVLYPTWVFFRSFDYRYDQLATNAFWGLAIGLGSTGAHQLLKENKDVLAKIPILGLAMKLLPEDNGTTFTKNPSPPPTP